MKVSQEQQDDKSNQRMDLSILFLFYYEDISYGLLYHEVTALKGSWVLIVHSMVHSSIS